jgi:hypothetical protein
MDRLISEKAVLEAFREYQGSISDFYKAVKAIPPAEPYKGMTNGEVFEEMYPKVKIFSHSYADSLLKGQYWKEVKIHDFNVNFPLDWWNSPYDPQERNDNE